jgi:hypothetical protein
MYEGELMVESRCIAQYNKYCTKKSALVIFIFYVSWKETIWYSINGSTI